MHNADSGASAESGASATPDAATPAATQFRVLEYSDDLAPVFRDINAEWIESMYRMEEADRKVLDNPRKFILDGGGAILFVEIPGIGIVGACALKRVGPGEFELTKMGVTRAARGLKAGEFLLRSIIERARDIQATLLFLLSNSKSEAAIHLYEKLGFVHDPEIMSRFGCGYERCNIAMRYAGIG